MSVVALESLLKEKYAFSSRSSSLLSGTWTWLEREQFRAHGARPRESLSPRILIVWWWFVPFETEDYRSKLWLRRLGQKDLTAAIWYLSPLRLHKFRSSATINDIEMICFRRSCPQSSGVISYGSLQSNTLNPEEHIMLATLESVVCLPFK